MPMLHQLLLAFVVFAPAAIELLASSLTGPNARLASRSRVARWGTPECGDPDLAARSAALDLVAERPCLPTRDGTCCPPCSIRSCPTRRQADARRGFPSPTKSSRQRRKFASSPPNIADLSADFGQP